ncbi:MAG TPA: GNAT family N-acetyltransferase [Candidatus Acidoferrum sp.]|nr:GNAT family N-acetyltransferase [Candidatus Acidoferrum sp.]
MVFKTAQPQDAAELSHLTYESKKFWGYPDAYMALWTSALTITPEYIENNTVVMAVEDGEIAGYFSIVEEGPQEVLEVGNYRVAGGFYLDNLFIHPEHIRQGLGRQLLDMALEHCRRQGITLLHVHSDPNAKGFYEAMGAEHLGDVPTKIPGRALPVMLLRL